ncbi:unnamed protein product [Cuscuta campestris]|uniref:Uncharacterized protein n=1 Tax=Cuscuta campestris TaxID=132261 RepID=A0A484KK07_9ASTE|nr:unnamed protein product [Cuscuta campestris]
MATKIRGGDIERVWSISNIALQGVKTGRADASFLEKYFFSYKVLACLSCALCLQVQLPTITISPRVIVLLSSHFNYVYLISILQIYITFFALSKQGDIPFENGRSHCFVFFKGYGSDALCLKISSASCLTCLSIVEHLFIVARFH